MTGPIYPNLTSVVPREDVIKIFALRYAIHTLCSQLKDHSNKRDMMQSKWVSIYRGARANIAHVDELISAKGSIISKVSFVCGSFDQNIAMSFATGDMKSPYRQSVLQKFNINTSNKEITYACLSDINQNSDEVVVIFPYLSLFRIDKVERTEHFWYVEGTVIDQKDKEFRSLIEPRWAELIDEQESSTPHMYRSYFRYLNTNNTSFLRFQVLVDAVLRLESNDFAKKEFIELCRSKYGDNMKILHQIDDFEQNYRREEAISWYTRDYFLFRTLNEALREEDYDAIIKLRYFIHDLHDQLANLQISYLRSLPNNQSNIVIYRGQRIPFIELERLREHQCSLISMNNFLSTTNNYDAAVFFSGEGNAEIEEGYVSVVFEISVDTRLPLNVPFAKIDYKSIFCDEEEILFSMAAVFRIQNIEKIHDKFWHVKMMLDKNMDNEQLLLLTNHLND